MTFAVALIWTVFGCKDNLWSENWDGADRETKRMGCFHYTHTIPYSSLTDRDRRTVAYVRNHATGLPFYPGPKERSLGVHSQDRVKEDIVTIWQKCQTPRLLRWLIKGVMWKRIFWNNCEFPVSI